MTILVGTSGNDYILASMGYESILGYSGNDTLIGYANNDNIYGGADDDLISGYGGNDHLYGEDGNDTLDGDAGNDTLDGGFGNDVLYTFGADSLFGGDGNDTLYENIGNDVATLSGGMGDDSYYISYDSKDIIIEEENAGNDTIFFNYANGGERAYNLPDNIERVILNGNFGRYINGNDLNNYMEGNFQDNYLEGGAGNDTILGKDGDDELCGNDGSDILYGGNGEDTIDGGTGSDTMIGGAGNDIYYYDNSGDAIGENLNEGIDTVITSNCSIALGDNVENLTITGSTALNGGGNSLDNYITGNSANNYLLGYNGNDTIDGGAGSDTMIGGAGNDTYYYTSGDVISESSTGGTDTVITSLSLQLGNYLENLTLSGTTGLTGIGNTLSNVITGASGADTLYGYSGNDTIFGGAGNDIIVADTGAHTGTGSTKLYGGTGADTIYGAGSSDTIDGGTDADILYGYAGNDTYNFTLGDGGDIILDTAGSADLILFDSSITRSNIAIYMDSENNLFVDYGTSAGSDIALSYNQSSYTVEKVQTSDGYYLSNTTITQLVQDIANYANNNGLTISCVEDVKSNPALMTLVNSAWAA